MSPAPGRSDEKQPVSPSPAAPVPPATGNADTGCDAGTVEVAHVLFMDMVAFSQEAAERQKELVSELYEIVRATPTFQRAHQSGKLIALDTGDGEGLVFFDDPTSPVRCALEIAEAIRNHPLIKLRMGVNSGAITRVTGIGTRENVAGPGANYGQRAMDCGDAGHILVTKTTAEFLIEIGFWRQRLHSIGEYEVKHGKKVFLYNLYTDTVGNPAVPVRKAGRYAKPLAAAFSVIPMGSRIMAGSEAGLNKIPRPVRWAVVLAAAAAVVWFIIRPAPANPHVSSNVLTANQPGQQLFPSTSPDNQWLIYAAKTKGNWDIYRHSVNVSGFLGPAKNLTAGAEGDNSEPAFSPDGKWIAFRSERGGGGIFRMDANGGQVVKLTNSGHNPAWSPDSKQICYATEGVVSPEDRLTSNSELRVVNVDTLEDSSIYSGDAVQPSWSPHGHRIAFWFVHNAGSRDIATIPATGGKPVLVTDDAFLDWNPVWGPDGKYLYYSTDRGRTSGLWRAAIDEKTGKLHGKPQPVEGDAAHAAHVNMSRDGSVLTYVHRDFSASIYGVEFNSAREKTEGEPLAVTQGKQATRPDLSPDGQWLTFNSMGEKKEDLFVVGTDQNAKPRALLNDLFKDRGPRWSPDGKQIAFFSNRSKNWEVWMIDRDGANLRQVTNAKIRGILYPVWCPQGGRMAYTIQKPNPAEVQPFVAEIGNPAKTQGLTMLGLTAWAWSPDGKKLAGYQQQADGSFSGIAVYFFDTGVAAHLTTAGSDPVWLSDSRRLLYNNAGKIYLVDSEHPGKPKLIYESRTYDVARRGFCVSKDDKKLYFSLDETQAHIWIGKFDDTPGVAQQVERALGFRWLAALF